MIASNGALEAMVSRLIDVVAQRLAATDYPLKEQMEQREQRYKNLVRYLRGEE